MGLRKQRFLGVAGLLVIALLLVGPSMALAQHGAATAEHESGGESGGHEATPWYRGMNLWKAINLTILVAVLYKLMAVPVKRVLSDRTHAIDEALRNVEHEQHAAREHYTEMQLKLSEAKQEIGDVIGRGQEEAQKIIEELNATTSAEVAILQKRLGEELEQNVNEARQELVAFLATKAIQRAEQKIKTMDVSKLQARYLRQFQQLLTLQGDASERPQKNQ